MSEIDNIDELVNLVDNVKLVERSHLSRLTEALIHLLSLSYHFTQATIILEFVNKTIDNIQAILYTKDLYKVYDYMQFKNLYDSHHEIIITNIAGTAPEEICRIETNILEFTCVLKTTFDVSFKVENILGINLLNCDSKQIRIIYLCKRIREIVRDREVSESYYLIDGINLSQDLYNDNFIQEIDIIMDIISPYLIENICCKYLEILRIFSKLLYQIDIMQ